MSIEQAGESKICPWWRRVVIYNGTTLALCGRETLDEPPLEDGEGIRLKECPWFGLTNVAILPAIMEYPSNTVINNHHYPEFIITAPFQGKKGIAFLEELWDQQVEEFIQRHSQ